MKVLIANNFFCYAGGVGTYISLLSKLLRHKGHETFFFASNRKPYIEPDYQYDNYFPEFINLRELSKPESLKYAIKSLYNIDAEKKLSALIKDIKPDIVHFNCINYHLTPSVLMACKKK